MTSSNDCSSNSVKTYESDDEVNISFNTGASGVAQAISTKSTHGIVISGEASESDEEIDSHPIPESPHSESEYVLNESWNKQWQDGMSQNDSTKDDDRIKYDSLLHKKLRERNQCLRKSLIEMACQPYQSASKEIHCISQQLIKSQLLVQEVTSTLRRLTNELFVLEDRVQSIKSGAFLPEIDVNAIPHLESP